MAGYFYAKSSVLVTARGKLTNCPDRPQMDKKTKKRLEVLRQKVEKTQKLIAAARQQTDDPDEVAQLENQITELKAEITRLKNG